MFQNGASEDEIIPDPGGELRVFGFGYQPAKAHNRLDLLLEQRRLGIIGLLVLVRLLR